MREHREWTPALDALIFSLRADGKTWDEVGETMDMPPSTVFKRWQKLQGVGPYAPQVTPEERSAAALREIINVPVMQPEPGPPHACCQWIFGDLRAGGFMCEGASLPGKSYCDTHQRRAFFTPKAGRKRGAMPAPDFSLANIVGVAA